MKRLFGTFCAAIVGAVASESATLSIISSNGLPEKRINFVVLAEGYKASEEAKFRNDATNAINNIFAGLINEPFLNYQRYFNAYAVFVPSQDSGADHPSQNLFKNTYFNSSFDTFGQTELLSIPPNSFDNNPNNGEQKAINLLQQVFPAFDVPIVLVNDDMRGGSAQNIAVVSINAESSRNLLVHELGHSMAGLGDEYETPAVFPDIEEPNTTRETNRALIKWNAWIRSDTLIPTPNKPPGSFTNSNRVGLFEGAHYHSNGWYRPKLNCKMRSASAEFCEVCKEALVKSFYERVRPVDGFSPSLSHIIAGDQQNLTFELQVLQPRTNNLVIQWFLNEGALLNETNRIISVANSSVPPGSNVLKAIVEDKTAMVRVDPASLLKQEVSWTIEKEMGSPLGIASITVENNNLVFTVTNASGHFIVERSTNLVNWVSISTNTSGSGPIQVAFTNAGGNFFRLKR